MTTTKLSLGMAITLSILLLLAGCERAKPGMVVAKWYYAPHTHTETVWTSLVPGQPANYPITNTVTDPAYWTVDVKCDEDGQIRTYTISHETCDSLTVGQHVVWKD